MSMRVIDTQAVYEDLLIDLQRLERRLRWQEAIAGLSMAVGTGFALAAVFVAAMRIWPLYSRTQIWQILAALMALSLAANFAYAFLRRRPRLEIARKLDAALGLHERISTAVDSHNRHARGTMVALQMADASRAVNNADLSRSFPIRIARRDLAFGALLGGLLLVALFAPNPFEGVMQQREAVKASQQAVATKLEQVERSIEAAPNADDPVRQQIVSEMEALRGDLAQGDLTREQALARMQDAEDNLKRLEDPAVLAQKEGLSRLGQELSKFTDPAVQQIANNLQLGNFQQAAQGVHDLANNLSNMSPAQLTALQQTLEQAAQATANVDPKLSALLQQAADALKRGDLEGARQALDAAAAQMGEEAQSIAAQQQLQQALAQVQDGEQAVTKAGQSQTAAAASQTAVAGNPQANGQPSDGQPGEVSTVQPGQGGTPVAGSAQQPGDNPQASSPNGNPQSGQNSSSGNGTPSANSQSGGSGAGKSGSTDKVYAPEPLHNPTNDATPLPLGGNGNGNGSGGGKPVGSGSGGAAGGTGGGSSAGNGSGNQVPYDQVYKQYSDKANSDLQNSYIPQNLKSYVRDYFTSLTPQQ